MTDSYVTHLDQKAQTNKNTQTIHIMQPIWSKKRKTNTKTMKIIARYYSLIKTIFNCHTL